MPHTIWTVFSGGLGLDADMLNLGQGALRALVVYVLAVFIVRFGEERFIGEFSLKANISRDHLLGALREEGRLTDPADVKEAWLDRSGNVSVIPKDD